jgi:hypothetical protein
MAPIDESRLRHPLEHPLFLASAALNLTITISAIVIVLLGTDWLEQHPRLAKHDDKIRSIAIAAVLAPFALVVLRNGRRAIARGNSVQVSPRQFPLLHATLERHAAALGMKELPKLYLGEDVIKEYAEAFSAWKHNYIVLAPDLLETEVTQPWRTAKVKA